MTIRSGFYRGTGAAINVELGWIPDVVLVSNLTDGDTWQWACMFDVVPFTSGGTFEIKKGMTIKGVTSGATAVIQEVILNSGTFAAGTAAGWLILDRMTKVGTLTAGGEVIYVIASSAFAASGTADDANITIGPINYNQTSVLAVGAVTTTSAITYYAGDTTHARGFTVGSVASEASKLFQYIAIRNMDGNKGNCANSA